MVPENPGAGEFNDGRKPILVTGLFFASLRLRAFALAAWPVLLSRCELGQARLARAGLDVWHGRAFGLFEVNLGAQQQRAQAKVGEGEHHVEILVHVAVV